MRTVITKLLIANRGEIAARIIRTAHAMDIATVALFSDADQDAPHVAQADESVHLPGGTPAETYLRADAVIDAVRDRRFWISLGKSRNACYRYSRWPNSAQAPPAAAEKGKKCRSGMFSPQPRRRVKRRPVFYIFYPVTH